MISAAAIERSRIVGVSRGQSLPQAQQHGLTGIKGAWIKGFKYKVALSLTSLTSPSSMFQSCFGFGSLMLDTVENPESGIRNLKFGISFINFLL
jgi:hypothetical protein